MCRHYNGKANIDSKLFVKNQNVTNDDIEVGNGNVPPAISNLNLVDSSSESIGTSNVPHDYGIVDTEISDTALPVVMGWNPNLEETINRYNIGNYSNVSSVSSLTNEERLSLFNNVWKPQPEYKFPKIRFKQNSIFLNEMAWRI